MLGGVPYFSRFGLNTYRQTPYFIAHLAAGCPVDALILATATFRELPPRLRRLAELSRAWAQRRGFVPPDIGEFYDAQGYELDPDTGQRATRAAVLAERGGTLPAAPIADIPAPPGGFADPGIWEEPPACVSSARVDRSALSASRLQSDIASRGQAATAAEYGVPAAWLARVASDGDLASMILAMHGKPWPVATE